MYTNNRGPNPAGDVVATTPSQNEAALEQARIHGADLLLFRQVKTWDEVEVARYRFPPGERKVSPLKGHVVRLHQSAPHYFVQRLDGRTRATTETSNLVTIIPADRPFEQVFEAESDDLNIVLPDRVVRRAATDAQIYPDTLEIVDCFCADDPYVRNLGLALGAELDGDNLGEALYAESLASALAVHLVRKYSTHGKTKALNESQVASSRLSRQILKRVTEYISTHLDVRLSLAELAAVANLSPFHFSRLFRATTGFTPHQYVIEQRARRAYYLLESTDLPIHEIAWRTGFSDQSHLGRHIRRRYGLTPRSIRG